MNADPVTLINSLSEDQIRERITDLERQRDALMVLLRALRRRRPSTKRTSKSGKGEAKP